jgi:ABC-type oligopeptide transport system ATPase subunit
MTALSIDGVSKLYRGSGRRGGATWALRKVSFGIKPGEVVTLIGESGSGKTTLGRIVLRLAEPTGGSIRFGGTDIAGFRRHELREYYRHVQGVFQDPFSSYNPIYKADRVLDVLREEYFRGLPRAAWDAKVESVLQAVALNPPDVLGKYPHQLSGGQQQRMLIARALLLDVKILVADEIISMLDASTRVDVLNLLVTLKHAGLGILFITHDLSLGNYISDRTVILRYGAVVEMGPTVTVFGNPLHPYTQMLLSAVPQLHKKWHPATQPDPGDGAATSRAAGHDRTGPTELAVSGRAQRAAGALPELARRYLASGSGWPPAKTGPPPAGYRAAEPPPLAEREPGHFVAAPED